jgi:Sec-independent protein translocase protein TatA
LLDERGAGIKFGMFGGEMANENRTQQASLGCGTLILIALIVLIFSGRGTGDLEREIHALKNEVRGLRNSVDGQTHEMRALRQRVDKLVLAAKE